MPLAGHGLVHPGLVGHLDAHGYYPHTVTVLRNTPGVRDEYGSPVDTWENLAGHVDLHARVVSNGPGTGAGGWSGEQRTPTGVYGIEGETMSLAGYYPTITKSDRVVFNGDVFDIQAVESDAQSATTRLRTRRVD